MTRDDIIRMAREAGLSPAASRSNMLAMFAALVAAAEREACAKACEDQRDLRKEDRLCERSDRAHKWESIDNALRTSRELSDVRLFHSGLNRAAAAIRARGQQ